MQRIELTFYALRKQYKPETEKLILKQLENLDKTTS
jgi:hypothetical protein